MKRKTIIMGILMLMTFLRVGAQQIKGVVIDATTGDSIAFASAIYHGHHVMVSADNKGCFEIARHNGWTLTISALGYRSQDIQIQGKTKSELRIRLKPESRTLRNVEVRSKRKSKYSRKDNPAVELMKRVIAAKKKTALDNHPYYHQVSEDYSGHERLEARRP